MEGVFAEAEALPHVSEVASPYEKGGAAAISDDGEIAYATVQFDVSTDKLERRRSQEADRRRPRRRAATGSRSSSAASRSRKPAAKKKATPRSMIGLLAAVVVLLITFGSLVAMGLPILTALFALGVGLSARHPRHPRLRHRRVRAAAGGR